MPSAEGSAVTVAVTVSEGVESSPNGRPSSATACFNLSVTVVADASVVEAVVLAISGDAPVYPLPFDLRPYGLY